MNICRDYSLTPDEVMNLPETDMIMYSMMKEKQNFEEWYFYKPKD